jgi:tRNA (guanine-N7-)-methyltransferase
MQLIKFAINMGHKKLIRFAAIKELKNVLEFPENMKGNWHTYFGNTNPIYLELACGKGEYTQNRAQQEPNINFIGIDIKGNRMYIGARNCEALGLKNAAYLRIPIDRITDYFDAQEIAQIWIIFPDPFLRDSKDKNRLTHAKFLAKYQQILQSNATVNLKTDSKPLFDFTLETIEQHNCKIEFVNQNIYIDGEAPYPLDIKTHYEKMHLADNRIIQYVKFLLPHNAIIPPPRKSKLLAENDEQGS